MEKAYLDSKGIVYKNIFVDQDPSAASEMIKISGQMGVPFTVITDDTGKEEHILGFDKDRINKILKIN